MAQGPHRGCLVLLKDCPSPLLFTLLDRGHVSRPPFPGGRGATHTARPAVLAGCRGLDREVECCPWTSASSAGRPPSATHQRLRRPWIGISGLSKASLTRRRWLSCDAHRRELLAGHSRAAQSMVDAANGALLLADGATEGRLPEDRLHRSSPTVTCRPALRLVMRPVLSKPLVYSGGREGQERRFLITTDSFGDRCNSDPSWCMEEQRHPLWLRLVYPVPRVPRFIRDHPGARV